MFLRNLTAIALCSTLSILRADDGTLAVKTKSGETVRVAPTPITRYMQFQGFGKPKRTGYLPISKDAPIVQPSVFLFEQRDPGKGWGLRLVKVLVDGDNAEKGEFKVKMGFSSMEAIDASLPLGDMPMPKPEKAPDGTWSLKVPSDLTKGTYAIVGFDDNFSMSIQGVSTNLLSFEHGIAWIFRVP
jgi:hypothetical protein